MKKKLTVKGLQEYCTENKVHSVLFYTENQESYRASDPCKIRFTFPVMLIRENPNLICLKSGSNSMVIDRVQSVEVDTETTVLGTILTVYCGDFGAEEYDNTYTLIAS